MGILSATIGGSQANPLLTYSVGTTVKPTEPAPITFAPGDILRFVELSVPGSDGSIRIEWVPVPNFSTGIGLPVSMIIGTDPPKAAVLKGDRFVEDEASNEPLITDEMRQLLPKFEDPFKTVFAPKDGRAPLSDLLSSPDNEGFFGTVGDAVSVGVGLGATIGTAAATPSAAAATVAGGPVAGGAVLAAGAAEGAALGAAAGALVGVGMYIGMQIAVAELG
jgi:hypothetical protein